MLLTHMFTLDGMKVKSLHDLIRFILHREEDHNQCIHILVASRKSKFKGLINKNLVEKLQDLKTKRKLNQYHESELKTQV
jgi:hypothetical protein